MKIMRLLVIYLLFLGAMAYANVTYTPNDALGTWEVDIGQTQNLKQDCSKFDLIGMENILYFLVFEPNKVDIKSMASKFNWHADGNGTIHIDKKDYYLSGSVKSITKDTMMIEFENKDVKYTILYHKREPLKAAIEPIQDILYQAKDKRGSYIFFLFHTHQYTLLQISLDDKEVLLFDKKDINSSPETIRNWVRVNGVYVPAGKDIYLFSAMNKSKIAMINHSEFTYQNRYKFKRRDEILKDFWEHNSPLVRDSAVHLDLNILTSAFAHGYTLTQKQKDTLLFDIVDNYIAKKNVFTIKDKTREKFIEVITFLHKQGMHVDVKKEEYHQATNYTDIIRPKQTLINNEFYKEALTLIKLGVKVGNLDLYFLMNDDRKKVSKDILNQFLDAYTFNPKGENLIFGAIKYDDFDIEKRVFEMGFNDTKAKDCCYDMDMVAYALTFGEKSKYKFLDYLLSHTSSTHPYEEIKKILKYQETKAKKRDKTLIKNLHTILSK